MDKPFKTIEEQVELLEARGVATDDDTPEVLLREGYYSVVNGYKAPFIDKEKTESAKDDRYLPGTSFADIYALFMFDRELRMLFFKYFAIAEEALKTASAYCFSEAHIGEKEPYLDASNYDTSPNQIGLLLSDFNTALGRKPHRKPKRKLYLEHYSKNHDEVPIWVLMKYLTLGQAFKFYCFQPESIRNEIAKAFSSLYANDHEKPIRISPRRLRLAYDHIKDFRNICAHDERFYCAKTSPSRDIAVTDVVNDMQLVLSKNTYVELLAQYAAMLLKLSKSLGPDVLNKVLKEMKVESIYSAFSVNE